MLDLLESQGPIGSCDFKRGWFSVAASRCHDEAHLPKHGNLVVHGGAHSCPICAGPITCLEAPVTFWKSVAPSLDSFNGSCATNVIPMVCPLSTHTVRQTDPSRP